MNRNNIFEKVICNKRKQDKRKSNLLTVMVRLLGKEIDKTEIEEISLPKENQITVQELLKIIDRDLMITVYSRKDGELEHKGLFSPKIEKSLNDLLSKFGDSPVMGYDIHKQYVLIYLDALEPVFTSD